MQRLFYWSPSERRLSERSADELKDLLGRDGWLWLDVAEPSSGEVREIGGVFGFDPLSVDDVLDVTLLPKVDHHAEYLFVVLHGVVAGVGQRLATSELDLFIGRRFLVTMHKAPLAGIDWIATHLDGEGDWEGTPASLAAIIANAGSRRYLPLLDALESRIEELEDLAIAADPAVLAESQVLRRDVILLRRIVGPERDVLRQLSQPGSEIVDAVAARAFGDVYDHVFRLVESLDSARALLGSVVEIYRGAVAERTNEVMKVLTVFSAILLPLSVIAGIWGMNFADLPGSAWRWGFVGLLAVMAVIAVALWTYFARRGFIGGPRLVELPKAVGLGLVHIGTAPLRAVGIGRRLTATIEDALKGDPSEPG